MIMEANSLTLPQRCQIAEIGRCLARWMKLQEPRQVALRSNAVSCGCEGREGKPVASRRVVRYEVCMLRRRSMSISMLQVLIEKHLDGGCHLFFRHDGSKSWSGVRVEVRGARCEVRGSRLTELHSRAQRTRLATVRVRAARRSGIGYAFSSMNPAQPYLPSLRVLASTVLERAPYPAKYRQRRLQPSTVR